MGRLVSCEEAGGEGELYGVDGEFLRFFPSFCLGLLGTSWCGREWMVE